MPSADSASVKPDDGHTLAITRMDVRDLKPSPSNPRIGDVEAIKESVMVNGVYRPVIVSRDNVILAGHHLVQALLELGIKKVDVVHIDIQGDSLAAAKILAADNRTSDVGIYDEALLIDMLAGFDGDLTGTGWDDQSVTALLASIDDSPLVFPDPEPLPRSGTAVTLVFDDDDYIAYRSLVGDVARTAQTEGDVATVLAALRAVVYGEALAT